MDHSCLRTHVDIWEFNVWGICGVAWGSVPEPRSPEVQTKLSDIRDTCQWIIKCLEVLQFNTLEEMVFGCVGGKHSRIPRGSK
jgi:hypothetical protein